MNSSTFIYLVKQAAKEEYVKNLLYQELCTQEKDAFAENTLTLLDEVDVMKGLGLPFMRPTLIDWMSREELGVAALERQAFILGWLLKHPTKEKIQLYDDLLMSWLKKSTDANAIHLNRILLEPGEGLGWERYRRRTKRLQQAGVVKEWLSVQEKIWSHAIQQESHSLGRQESEWAIMLAYGEEETIKRVWNFLSKQKPEHIAQIIFRSAYADYLNNQGQRETSRFDRLKEIWGGHLDSMQSYLGENLQQESMVECMNTLLKQLKIRAFPNERLAIEYMMQMMPPTEKCEMPEEVFLAAVSRWLDCKTEQFRGSKEPALSSMVEMIEKAVSTRYDATKCVEDFGNRIIELIHSAKDKKIHYSEVFALMEGETPLLTLPDSFTKSAEQVGAEFEEWMIKISFSPDIRHRVRKIL